jgi:phosphoglycerate dehydrogenase-like enzyme
MCFGKASDFLRAIIGASIALLKEKHFALDDGRIACEIFAVASINIASTLPLNDSQRAVLRAAAPNAEITDRTCRTPDEVRELVAGGCDALLTFMTPGDLSQRAPNLKWVQLLSAGADHALAAVKGASFTLTTASGIHATPIAEYTVASMLAYAHGFHQLIRAQLRHEWKRSGFPGTAQELRGLTFGIIGYGSIGRESARMAQALGMRVLALKRDPANRRDDGWCPAGLGDPEGTIPEKFFGPEQREEIVRESDYLSVTLPLTEHTRKFIGAKEIAAMRPDAYIVNIGRGEVIDEAALIEALKAGKIGGAGLDVFEKEPLPKESPIWDLENVILTPHMSGANRGYVDKACALFADNLRRFVAGQPLLNVVNPQLGY